ncbi:LysR family transcriptional regulator [Pseudoclavibacter endophyticus]|uniref:LysR family transcriptional regulator n=1 Tax=Pseudoclavibacter endophyticus TaxID=1778590 RepID=A0A6H9WEN1_9MICO|nr:LysR substrate-binding domain-containing protein [Pseudoclavibacter endophyticus]KAB1649362.1 LysR family transcriptional regulator [Pseudoclavibacter endophyticus]GGA63185.1 LysR family transcriptional regulator [Pseudoclavibacter endophyticus]
MRVNLEQLRGFLAIVEHGTFTNAADALHLTQPSLSRQISALETDLTARLFDRTRAGTSITAAGTALLPHARRLLADADAARRELAELEGLRRGRVRLGATPTLCVSLVADALTAYRAEHPGIELHLSARGSRDLVEELSHGGLDLALVTTSDERLVSAAGLARTPLLDEELVVVTSAETPPSGSGLGPRRTSLTLDELASLPLIVLSESYDLRVATDAAFAAAGVTPSVALEGAEMDAALRFVERGLGVAVVPAMVLAGHEGLRALRLAGPQLQRTVSLAHRRGTTQSRAALAMRRRIIASADALATALPTTIRRTDSDDA